MLLRNAVNLYNLRGPTPLNVASLSYGTLCNYLLERSVLYASKVFFELIQAKCHERHNKHGVKTEYPVKGILSAFVIKYQGKAILWFPERIVGCSTWQDMASYERECHQRLAAAAKALTDKIDEIYLSLDMTMTFSGEPADFKDLSHECTENYEALLKNYFDCYKDFERNEKTWLLIMFRQTLHDMYTRRDEPGANLMVLRKHIEAQEAKTVEFFGIHALAEIQMDYDVQKKEKEEKVLRSFCIKLFGKL